MSDIIDNARGRLRLIALPLDDEGRPYPQHPPYEALALEVQHSNDPDAHVVGPDVPTSGRECPKEALSLIADRLLMQLTPWLPCPSRVYVVDKDMHCYGSAHLPAAE